MASLMNRTRFTKARKSNEKRRVEAQKALGLAKAAEHIDLMEQFYAVHDGNPEHNLAHQFFASLVEPSPGDWASYAYAEKVNEWRNAWVEAHPERADEDRHLFHMNLVPGPFPGTWVEQGQGDHRTQEQHDEDREALRALNLAHERCVACGGPISEEGDCA